MLLVLSEDHKEHLSFLTKVDGSVVEEFGRIALEFLKKGTNPKVYEGAASRTLFFFFVALSENMILICSTFIV
ncbi:COMM domain-containing protein 2 [Ataeniobius toweri]|uniref:COMM domain-containing protein 2 n=1 Tax=Ataeniobius toweri TaxID=208326 RepID=A0ABU7AG78_9TELE|nr:COMM domain-containing protein 2 [Ataeniobius toweri]